MTAPTECHCEFGGEALCPFCTATVWRFVHWVVSLEDNSVIRREVTLQNIIDKAKEVVENTTL